MTREEKDLLLQDLCGRLPYGVKCAYFDGCGNERDDVLNGIMPHDERILVGKCSIDYSDSDILGLVPYLFPMSSMTEEQKNEFDARTVEIMFGEVVCKKNDEIGYGKLMEFDLDFYNKHHLDWRGLIPMGLAIDATNLNIY